MSQQVELILLQIDQLNQEELQEFEQRLQERAEAQWHAEAAHARAVASERGINDREIDDVIANLRYGS